MPPTLDPSLHPPSGPDRPGVSVAFYARAFAQVSFVALLTGYLIFNRSFATLGFPPFYIGEIVLGFSVIAALVDFKKVFIAPLQHSRAMQLIALFLGYCAVRVCIDAPQRGLDAARDGVIGLYAVAAFTGPWCLSRMGSPYKAPAQSLVKLLTIVCAPAVLWGWGIYLGWIHAPSDVKVDFLTLSAAVAATVYSGQLLALIFVERPMRRRSAEKATRISVFESFILLMTLASAGLVLCLPTRAIQPGLLMFAVLPFGIALACPASRKKALVALVVMACVLGIAGGLVLARNHALLEKIEAVADPDDSHFKTREGQLAAHSGKWRVTFWKHCVQDTLARAPVFGLGFGTNLTDLLRDTPDWPLFADSQDAAKYGSANRHPHSAHIGIFARLGGAGLVVWLALLAAVLIKGCKNVWRCNGDFRIGALSRSREFFAENTLVSLWLIYVLAMSFGVVLENPFGGIWFWTLTGLIAQSAPATSFNASKDA